MVLSCEPAFSSDLVLGVKRISEDALPSPSQISHPDKLGRCRLRESWQDLSLGKPFGKYMLQRVNLLCEKAAPDSVKLRRTILRSCLPLEPPADKGRRRPG